jgi:eukaryotic-like serine/threonine-protein kinase
MRLHIAGCPMTTDPTPDTPDAVPAPAAVRNTLRRILESASFVHSPRLQRFLAFLVEETLAGRGGRLKEYVIGLEVFARPATYDPRFDSLVRVEARRLRAALAGYYANDGRDEGIVIELQKGRYVPAFRFASAPTLPALPAGGQGDRQPPSNADPSAAGAHAASRWRRAASTRGAVALLVLAAAALVFGIVRASRQAQGRPLTERDAIVLVDFANATGEPIFDETLKQGLNTQLEQSPFLNVVPDRRVAQALKLMGAEGSGRLSREQARELCLRAGATVLVAGSISRLGTQYVIGLTATDCGSGNEFLHVQEVAARREGVLRSLGESANAMRRRLGESLKTIGQFGMPVEEATTPSLEALQAYSVGRRTAREKGTPADIPFYQRATELDPDFAVAHAALGVSYMNQGQVSAARECLERAQRLSDRVSEREKYRIAAYYHQAVTGDLERAAAVYEIWMQSYPREFAAQANLALAHIWLGDYEKALAEARQALRLEPGNVLAYTNLAAVLIKLERPQEAKAALDQAAGRDLTSTFLRANLCYLAFLQGDEKAIEKQIALVGGSPADEAVLVSLQSDTEAYYGRLGAARALSRRAVNAASQSAGRESAAVWLVNAALREAEFGNAVTARQMVQESLDLSGGRDVTTLGALALARAGDAARATELARTVESAYPRNTAIAKYWLPTIRAAVELAGSRPGRALALLEPVSPYELASPPPIGLATLYPIYLRGAALLRERRGVEAVSEFRKVLDRPGLALNSPLRALSRLQVARGHRLCGDVPAARLAFDDFFDLWKTADADLPILRQARAERAQLR